MSDWHEYYKDRGDEYYEYFKEKYQPFLYVVKNYVKSRVFFETIAEVGCGTANTTRFLLEEAPKKNYHCMDIDNKMVNLAMENIGMKRRNVTYHIQNVLKSIDGMAFDVVHSHGLLEHFSDIEIQRIFLKLARASDVQVHYIPSDGYKEQSFGDERLLPLEHWMDLISRFSENTGIKVNSKGFYFNDNKDICLTLTK